MSEDRELERRVRSAISRVQVPTGTLREPSGSVTPTVAVLAVLILAFAIGVRLVSPSFGSPAGSTPDPGLSDLPSVMTRDQAIAFVRGLHDQVGRVDRVDAKLVTYEEYTRIAGQPRGVQGDPYASPDLNAVSGYVGDPSQRYVWVVAVSGEVWPAGHLPIYWGHQPPTSPTPFPPYRWAMFLVDAGRADSLSAPSGGAVAAGIAEAWPSMFDRLPSHTPTRAVPTPTATSRLAPISVPMLGPEAMSSVLRSLYAGGTPRVDRIEYKLMTVSEFRTKSALGIAMPDGTPVWVVAVSGDIPSLKKSPSEPDSYRSELFVVDATSRNIEGDIVAVWRDDVGPWPASFDALPDHPAVAAPYPSPTLALGTRLGTRLGVVALGMTAADVRAALGDPAESTITHGMGTPEWHYADGVWVYLGGPLPGTVWQIRVTAPFDRGTAEGVRIGSTLNEARAIYPAATAPSDGQLQISDGAGTTLGLGFDATGRVEWMILNTQP